MLCRACNNILTAVKSSPPGSWSGDTPRLFEYPSLASAWAGSHHIEPEEFLSAARGRCYICSTIFRDSSTELRTQAHLFRTFFQLRPVWDDDLGQPSKDHYELEFTIEILQGKAPIAEQQVFDCSGTFKILPRNEVQVTGKPLALTSNTWSEPCQRQIQSWLSTCGKSHVDCKQDWRTRHSYPARLLNIGRRKGDLFRLEIIGKDSHCPKYATMSHCWQAGTTLKLEEGTQQKLIDGLPATELPPRFQDAISIAQWMQVEYLWIDALCIQQDSDEDWRVQSTKMGDIYAGSYCNIAATSAVHRKGCFTNRPTELVEPYFLSDPQANSLTETHVLGYDDFWSNSLLDTTLHTRAWVLQERLLSPRTIHFGQEQMFWECRCQLACETYPGGIPAQFCNWRTSAWRQSDQMIDPAKKRITEPPTQRRNVSQAISKYVSLLFRTARPKTAVTQLDPIHAIWSKTIERYMQCKLTVGGDKLVAIAGIAQKVAEVTNERYLAGLWDTSSLPQSLLWYVLGRSQADDTPSTRSALAVQPGYRAPSWSWASLDAQLIWNWPSECDKVLINILDTFVEGPHNDTRSRVSSARMEVQGHMFQASLQVVSKKDDGSLEEDGRYALQLNPRRAEKLSPRPVATDQVSMEPTIYLDTPLMPEFPQIDTCLLPICTDWRGLSGNTIVKLAGLMLRKVASQTSNAQYSRIGIFGLDNNQARILCGIDTSESDCVEVALADRKKTHITLV